MANMPVIPFSNGFTTEHFEHLFTQTDYPRWFLNTLIIAVSTCLGTLVFASLGAYVFSRFQFTFKRPLLMSMLILQVFPSIVGMVAIYMLLYRIGGLDTLWGLVLFYLAGNMPFMIWLVKSYMDGIPRSLDEAARIDGASNFRIYAQIIVPVARPILTFLAVTSFVAPWMDFILPKLILRSPERQTLALGLFSFVTDKNNFFTTFAAGGLLVAVPFVIFFIATQKSLIASLAGGAVKE
jgi:arabinogalactan oligomer/maltooligosaccharide transport system permease protein